MRFMMFMIPPEYQASAPADKKAGKDFAPPAEAVEAMTRYNEELAKAGVLLSLDGLHPLLKGARIKFHGGKQIVTDGPYIEAKEVIGGYWILNVKSKEEAVEWARKCPAVKVDSGAALEVRQVYEVAEFSKDLQKIAESSVIKQALENNR